MGVQAYESSESTVADCAGPRRLGSANPAPRLVVGRVGALAAALGIGAAVLAVPGPASADTGGSGGASGSASSAESPAAPSRGATRGSSRTAGKPAAPASGRQVSVPARVSNDSPTSAPTAGRTGVPQIKGAGSKAPAVVPAARAATATARSARLQGQSSATGSPGFGNAGAAAVALTPEPGQGGELPLGSAGSGAAPRSAPLASFEQLVQRIDAQNQAAVSRFFHTLLNWTATLPTSPLTSWLEGGLLMVRKHLFDQTPGVRSIQTANAPTLVTGKIEVVDPEGDPWSVDVVGNPGHGTVTLGTAGQGNGIGMVTYTYVPGDGYVGTDQFVVKVTSSGSGVNLLRPFGGSNTRTYTVEVGDAAEAGRIRFNAEGADPKDVLDTHLYLSNASATVTVRKQGLFNPQYRVTVKLPAGTAAKSFSTMDIRGNLSSVSVDTMLREDWGAYTKKAAQNGVKPLLMLKYSDGGVDKAVLADISGVTKNADGSYVLSGQLMADVPALDGRVDSWDFIGFKYKKAYEDFLTGAGLADCKAGQQCASVSVVGKLALTTLSSSAFADTGGHDYRLAQPGDASATQTSPGSMGPGTAPGNGTEQFGSTNSQEVELTAMIPWGASGSFISATNLTQGSAEGTPNGIFLNTPTVQASGKTTYARTQLVGNQWNAAVNAMARYDQVLLDDNGNPVPTTLSGTLVTPTTVTIAVPVDVNPGSLIGQQITGQPGAGIADGTVISGFVSAGAGSVTYSVNKAIASSSASGTIAVTFPDIPALQPGLVVGLSDGSVYYWNGHSCSKPLCTAPTVDYDNPAVIQTDSPALNPVSIAIGPDGTLYAAGASLQFIDTATNEVTGSAITTLTEEWSNGSFPAVAINPNGVYAYTTSAALPNTTAQGIAVVATATKTVQANIPLPEGATANGVAVSPDGNVGYIASASGAGAPSVYQFDANTNALVGGPIALPAGNYVRTGMAVSGDGAYLYVSNAANGTVSVIDTATNQLLADPINVQGSPGAMAVSPDGRYVIVAQVPNTNPSSVSVIDTTTNTVTATIAVGNGPAGVAFNPVVSASRAYVTNSNDSTMSIVDTQNWTVIATVPTGAGRDDTLGVGITADGATVYLANFSGGGDSNGTVSSFQVGIPVPKEWVQLQAPNAWGANVAVNTVTALADNSGFAVGLSDGQVGVWTNPIKLDGTILPGPSAVPGAGCSNGNNGNCWFTIAGSGPVDAVIPSGQGLVAVSNSSNGALIQTWDGKGYNASANVSNIWNPGPNATTVLPYDGTTLVGSIGGTALWADAATDTIAPFPDQALLVDSPAYLAASASCSPTAANPGVGCSGFVLTVQQALGNPIRVGQTLYGGAGLLPGTVITQQISDAMGNLCSSSCFGGGNGVYLVNTSQLVAPGTPMSASDGTGFIVGHTDGTVDQFGYPGSGTDGARSQVQLNGGVNWGAAVNTMIPWRDGLALGLNNGAVMYWSPSNNPDGNSGLSYQGYRVTPQTDAPAQPAGWSQLVGYLTSCGCFGPFTDTVSSMVQMGDGFAVGLTNGEVWGFNGFGPVAITAAFGRQPDGTAIIPADSFIPMATSTTLGGGTNDSVQQLIPVTQLALDDAGNPVFATSVLAGLTNNAIYAWDGTNQWSTSDLTTWNQLQPPGDASITSEILQEAWAYATSSTATNAWAWSPNESGTWVVSDATGVGAPYTPASADGKTPASGDPLFSLPENLPAGCGYQCSGTYVPILYYKQLGEDGVIYSIGDNPGIQGNLNLSLVGYGYVFVPSGFLDKFEPDSYSASLLLAVQGGPSVVLNPPDNGLYLKASDKITGPSWSDTQGTEAGIFAETVGINASISAKVGLSDKPLNTLTLASAYYTPGLLVSWNTDNYPTQMGVTFSSFASTYVITADKIKKYFDPSKADASLSVTATPYAKLTYGLFTPPQYPSLDIVSLSVGYANPVTATLNVPLNDLPTSIEDSTLKITSSGVLTVGAGILPSLTKALSWSDKFKVYSVSDTFKPLKNADL